MSTLLGCSSSKAELYDKVFKTVGEDKTRFAAIKRYEKREVVFPHSALLTWFTFFSSVLSVRLGLLSNEIAAPKSSPLDTLSQHLSEKLAFGM